MNTEDIQQRTKNSIFTLFGVLIVLVVVIFFVFSFNKKSDNLKGTIYLSLKEDRLTESVAGFFRYNLENNKFGFFDDEFMNMYGHISSDGRFGVISSLEKSLMSEKEEVRYLFQLYQIDFSSGKRTQITKSSTYFKRAPEWSPDGTKVAFMARQTLDYERLYELSTWSVFVTDLEGSEKFVATGLYPQWAPDGRHLLVLGYEGLYLFDIYEETGHLIWPVESGEAYFNMNLDLSKDGRIIAWSSPGTNEVVLIRVNSWNPFDAEILKRINTDDHLAFSPIISEDNKYMAVLEVDEGSWEVDEEIFGNSSLRLVVYELKNFESKIVLDLKDYAQESMAVLDWRY